MPSVAPPSQASPPPGSLPQHVSGRAAPGLAQATRQLPVSLCLAALPDADVPTFCPSEAPGQPCVHATEGYRGLVSGACAGQGRQVVPSLGTWSGSPVSWGGGVGEVRCGAWGRRDSRPLPHQPCASRRDPCLLWTTQGPGVGREEGEGPAWLCVVS